jgi:oligosaccharide repeat unit polymerase
MYNLIGILAAFLFGIVTYGLSGMYGDHDALARLLMAASLMCWAYVLWRTILDAREHYIMLCVALFNVFGFILPGMLQTANGRFPWFALAYPSDVILRAAFVVFAYSFAVCTFYLYIFSRLKSDVPIKNGEVRLDRSMTLAGIVGMAFVALIGIYAVGPQYFLSERSSVSLLDAASGGKSPGLLIAITIVRDAGFFSLALFVTLLHERRISKSLLVLLGLLAVAAFLLTDLPYNVARFNLLALILAMFPLYFTTRKRSFKTIFVGGYVSGLLILMPVLNILSRGQRGAEVSTNFLAHYSNTVDFDGFQSMLNVILWIDQVGLNWGHQILSAILFFVPHEIWAGKAIATGSAGALYMRYPMINISSPLPIEFYSDFGLIGTVILAALFGAVLAALDARLEGLNQRGFRLAILPYALAAGYAAILIRGPLLSVIGPAVAVIVLSVVVVKVFSSRRRKSA